MGTDVLKYGWVGGGKIGIYKKVTVSYFNRKGAAFVAASGPTGVKLVAASTESVMGWAEAPRDAAAGTVDYWTRTDSNDKVFVITDPSAIFAVPILEATFASLAASLEGYAVCASIVGAANGSSTAAIQKVQCKPAAAANAQLECVKVDMDRRVMYVRMNPTQRML